MPRFTNRAKLGLWNRLQSVLSVDPIIQNFVNGEEPVIIIDQLNQKTALASTFRAFNKKVGLGVLREKKYRMTQILHSQGCNRKDCMGRIGIRRIRLGDPTYINQVGLLKELSFEYLALQAPQLKFIEVDRKNLRREDLYLVDDDLTVGVGEDMVNVENMIRVTANGSYDKEMDDYVSVGIFLNIFESGHPVFIQSCDKYRWIRDNNVKKNQVIPFFLAAENFSIPFLVLMGFECAYDCTTKQLQPHTKDRCRLRVKDKDPIIYL